MGVLCTLFYVFLLFFILLVCTKKSICAKNEVLLTKKGKKCTFFLHLCRKTCNFAHIIIFMCKNIHNYIYI